MLLNSTMEEISDSKYILVHYYLESTVSVSDAAWNIAVGQSIGNPKVRNDNENNDLIEKHGCKIVPHDFDTNAVTIAFPIENFKYDSITQLLVAIMGGQLDIASITKCQIKNISFPHSYKALFPKSCYGIEGLRRLVGRYNKPLLGGIIKPKIGMDIATLRGVVEDMLEGGCDIIKEDEILGSYKLDERIQMVEKLCEQKPDFVYLFCNNNIDDYIVDVLPPESGIHINFWAGFNTYQHISKVNVNHVLFFQRSGIQILTNSNHDYHIDFYVICKIAALLGVDIMHVGMIGGYSPDKPFNVLENVAVLQANDILPSLSCGMHPGLVEGIVRQVGTDFLANVGGAIHGHPGGTLAGAKAMRQAIDGTGGKEFDEAINLWGTK